MVSAAASIHGRSNNIRLRPQRFTSLATVDNRVQTRRSTYNGMAQFASRCSNTSNRQVVVSSSAAAAAVDGGGDADAAAFDVLRD